jgi:hypothetical protein
VSMADRDVDKHFYTRVVVVERSCSGQKHCSVDSKKEKEEYANEETPNKEHIFFLQTYLLAKHWSMINFGG